MEFEKMGIEDLLADDSFINFCRKTSPEDIAKWEQFLELHPDHKPLIDHARTELNLLVAVIAQADYKEQEAILLTRMEQATPAPVVPITILDEKKQSRKKALYWKIAGAAAITILGIFLLANWGSSDTEATRIMTAAAGERKNLQLPDGSGVTLNGGSRITIYANFGKTGRDIFLEGEAFFDVKHDDELPFIVHTTSMDVKALGTAFNVKAYPTEKTTEASLIRGLVEVTLKQHDNRKMLLRPNQKIQWHKAETQNKSDVVESKVKETVAENAVQSLTKTESGAVKEIAWTENKLVFFDETLEDIAVLLERWYGADIEFTDDEIRGYRFTGEFEQEELGVLLGFLKESKGFNYQIINGTKLTVKLSK